MSAAEGGPLLPGTTGGPDAPPGRERRAGPAAAALVEPGTTLAAERLLPVVPALRPLLPGQGLRRGSTVPIEGWPRAGSNAARPPPGLGAMPAIGSIFGKGGAVIGLYGLYLWLPTRS